MLAKKFKSLDHFYDNREQGYKLLPLRFTKINEKDYILTNEVGEFCITSREDLNSFIKKNLDSRGDLYRELKSKHFLYDSDSTVAFDLLSLKYRTKSLHLREFTSLHLFVVTLRCDYSCPYCQVSRQSEDKDAFDMSFETADKALAMVFKSPAKNLKIEFQGGEPLLNFELIKYIVKQALEINKVENRGLQFVIATNLSFMDDTVLDFCEANDIYISTSLDGSESLHNKNRPRKDKNSYEVTIKGINKVMNRLGPNKISALMTTTEDSLTQVKDIINTYISLGFNNIFLRPLSPYGFAVKTKQINKYNVDKWMSFYKEGLDYIIELNKSGIHFAEQYSSIILNKMFSNFPTGYVDLQSPSGLGISVLVYNYDAKVYASDESRMLAEMGDDNFCLGDLSKDSYEDIMLSDKLLDTLDSTTNTSSPMCSECAFLNYCGSDPVYHHTTQKDMVGHKAYSGFCHKNMSIFKHLANVLKNDDSAREVLLGWVRR